MQGDFVVRESHTPLFQLRGGLVEATPQPIEDSKTWRFGGPLRTARTEMVRCKAWTSETERSSTVRCSLPVHFLVVDVAAMASTTTILGILPSSPVSLTRQKQIRAWYASDSPSRYCVVVSLLIFSAYLTPLAAYLMWLGRPLKRPKRNSLVTSRATNRKERGYVNSLPWMMWFRL